MSQSQPNAFSKICSGVLLFLGYHIVLLLLALMNTAIWTTELPRIRIFHHPSLYAIVKGFNVFFGCLVLIIIIIICYKIGDRILRIANLRIRANYNFYLFIFSFLVVIFFPIGYVGISRHIGTMLVHEKLTNFALLTLICFVTIDSLIIFVFCIFLLLTSIMATMRSYNIFRHLVKLSEERKRPKAPPQQQTTVPMKLRRSNAQMIGPLRRYPGRGGIFPATGVYSYPTNPRSNQRLIKDHRRASLTSGISYRIEPVLMQRYGYEYVVTPTLTPYPSEPTSQYSSPVQELSESQVFLV